MDVIAFGITDIGLVRGNNEDSLMVDDQLGVYAVADGMGGHLGGEVASRMALDVVRDYMAKAAAGSDIFLGTVDQRFSRQANLLASGVRLANRAIFEAARSNPAWQGMGTTLDAVRITESGAAIAHVGDSRVYLLREGVLQQLSSDHSLVAEQVRQGLLTTQEARASKLKNVITRALGQWEELEVDMLDVKLVCGDRLLLCSDGLSGMVDDGRIGELLRTCPEPEVAGRSLVKEALANGGRDNVTAVVLAFQERKGFVAGLKKMLLRDER